MRVVFVGTPEFSAEILEHLIRNDGRIVGVVTQPDKPKGRGRRLAPPPVKVVAQMYGIPFLQPESINRPECLEFLKTLNPDLILVVSYGKILGEKVLNLPKLGCYNVHPSLLPKYRGASPIHRVLENGEEKTGVTIYRMVKELDAGPVALQVEVPIDPFETHDQLERKLLEVSKSLVLEFVRKIENGNVVLREQDHSAASYAPLIRKEDLMIDFARDAVSVKDKIRAYDSKPGASCVLNGQLVKLFGASAVDSSGDEPGLVHQITKEGAWVGTGKGKVLVKKILFPGKRVMSFWDAKNGGLIKEGEILT